jgi:hypothetical protein
MQFQITNLLKVKSKLESSKEHFTSCNVSKSPYGFQDNQKINKSFILLNVF